MNKTRFKNILQEIREYEFAKKIGFRKKRWDEDTDIRYNKVAVDMLRGYTELKMISILKKAKMVAEHCDREIVRDSDFTIAYWYL